jgi:hypothetical protein
MWVMSKTIGSCCPLASTRLLAISGFTGTLHPRQAFRDQVYTILLMAVRNEHNQPYHPETGWSQLPVEILHHIIQLLVYPPGVLPVEAKK